MVVPESSFLAVSSPRTPASSVEIFHISIQMSSWHLKLSSALELDPDAFLSPVFPISVTDITIYLVTQLSRVFFLYPEYSSKSFGSTSKICQKFSHPSSLSPLSKLSSAQPPKSLTAPTLVLLEPNLRPKTKPCFRNANQIVPFLIPGPSEHSHHSDSKGQRQRQRSTFPSHFLSRSPFPSKLATLVSLL